MPPLSRFTVLCREGPPSLLHLGSGMLERMRHDTWRVQWGGIREVHGREVPPRRTRGGAQGVTLEASLRTARGGLYGVWPVARNSRAPSFCLQSIQCRSSCDFAPQAAADAWLSYADVQLPLLMRAVYGNRSPKFILLLRNPVDRIYSAFYGSDPKWGP